MSIPFKVDFLGKKTPAWLCDLNNSLWNILDGKNFVTEYIPEGNKWILQTVKLSNELGQEVTALLKNAIPQNITMEYDPFPLDYTRLAYLESPFTSYAFGSTSCFHLGDYTYNVSSGANTLRMETEHCIPNVPDEYPIGLGSEGLMLNCGTFGLGIWDKARPHYGGDTDRVEIKNYAVVYDRIKLGYDFTFTVEGEQLDNKWHVLKSSITNKKITFELDERYAERLWSQDPKATSRGPEGTDVPLYVFGCEAVSNISTKPFLGRKKYFKFWLDDILKHHVVAAVDDTGTPCMYDLVSKQPFYNVGVKAFIAGIETINQLYSMLANLPDLTGQEQKTLPVRLAAHLQTDELRHLIDARAETKNWEITEAPEIKIAS